MCIACRFSLGRGEAFVQRGGASPREGKQFLQSALDFPATVPSFLWTLNTEGFLASSPSFFVPPYFWYNKTNKRLSVEAYMIYSIG